MLIRTLLSVILLNIAAILLVISYSMQAPKNKDIGQRWLYALKSPAYWSCVLILISVNLLIST